MARRRRRSVSRGVAAALVALVGVIGSTAASFGGEPATRSALSAVALYTKTIADAEATRGVREISKTASKGFLLTSVLDASATGGNDVATVAAPPSLFGFTARLIGSKLYLDGDQDSLETLLAMDQMTVGLDAGYWRIVPTTSKYFEKVSYGISLSSSISQISLAPPFSLSGPLHYDGVAAYAISSGLGEHAGVSNGPERGKFVLYVTATATPLPIAEVATDVVDGVAQVDTTTFSRWGEKVLLNAPKIGRPVH